MAKNYTLAATSRLTDDNLLGTNNVGGDIQISFSNSVTTQGYIPIAQNSGAGAQQILPTGLSGSEVQVVVFAIYDSAEPDASKQFTLVEDSGGTPETVTCYGPIGAIGTALGDVTIQTGTANSVNFYIQYFVLG